MNNLNSSQKKQSVTIVVIIGLIAIAIAGYFASSWKTNQVAKEHTARIQSKPNEEVAPPAIQTISPFPPPITGNIAEPQLEQDEKNLDVKMQELSNEAKNIDQSINDYNNSSQE